MAARNTATADIESIVLPYGDGLVNSTYQRFLSPQNQERTGDFAIGIGLVMFQIDRSGGAIILAGGMNTSRIIEASQVLCESLGGESVRAAPQADIAQVVFRVVTNQSFRQAARLNQKEPVVIGSR